MLCHHDGDKKEEIDRHDKHTALVKLTDRNLTRNFPPGSKKSLSGTL